MAADLDKWVQPGQRVGRVTRVTFFAVAIWERSSAGSETSRNGDSVCVEPTIAGESCSLQGVADDIALASES
jgi:hypothetical protein